MIGSLRETLRGQHGYGAGSSRPQAGRLRVVHSRPGTNERARPVLRHGSQVTEIYHARDDNPAELARLAAEGVLRRVVADAYVRADVADDVTLRAAALARVFPPALGDRAPVAARETAGWLYTGDPPPDDLDVYVPAHRSRRRFRGLRIHEGLLDLGDVETVGQVRVTSPARTAADLCRSRPTDTALAHLDRLRSTTGLEPRVVLAVLERMARHRGVPHGKEVVQLWAARVAGAGLIGP